MISSGLETLDSRLGRLRPGATYAFFGPGASGKSVLALHFLAEGLQRNEPSVLVTRDEPAIIDSRAMFLGYMPGRFTEHPSLRVVRLPATLPAAHGLTPGAALATWLKQELADLEPSRIVLDGLEGLGAYSHSIASTLNGVLAFLGSTKATVYALGRLGPDLTLDTAYEPLTRYAEAICELEISERGERRFIFHTVPDQALRPEPFNFSLRVGAGLTEEHETAEAELSAEDRRRLVVLDEAGTVSAEVLNGLEKQFDLVPLRSAAGALSTLSAGRYGALVLAVDPYDEMRAFDLAFALRREGNSAPIIFIAPSKGLRSSTRSRGLRVGGDDFFVAELPASEVVERIHMAWSRGRHRRGGLTQIGQIVQPRNNAGLPRPMSEVEFRQAMDILLAEQPPLFFCYLEFTLAEGTPDLVWPALRGRVRIGDGDIIGLLDQRRFACVLDRITPEQTERVVERIRTGHPALRQITGVTIIPSPIHAESIQQRLGGSAVDAKPSAGSRQASATV